MKKLFLLTVIFLITGFAISQNYQWQFVSYLPAPNPPINSISVIDQNRIWVCCDASGGAGRVYYSSNGGVNWVLRNTGLPASNCYGIDAYSENIVFVGMVDGDLYKTTDGGLNWTRVLDLTNSFCNGVKMYTANYGFYFGDPTASGQPYQIRVTTNGGNNWNLVPGSPIAGSEYGVINAWDFTDTLHVWMGSANTVASSTNAKVYRTSTGFYGTWANTVVNGTGGSSGCYFQAVAFINNNSGMVGSSGGDIRKTTDGGVTFTNVTPPVGLTSYAVINMNGLKDNSNTIRMSTIGDSAKIFRTTNLGTTWIQEYLPAVAQVSQVQHIQFVNSATGIGFGGLGASGGLGGLIKYAPVTGITNSNGIIPSEYLLSQNYPNPFNPSTSIKFSLPKSGNVILKVYNSLGKEVETLISEDMVAGTYTVSYDASKLTSGMYFYKISVNGFTDTKKMMLVK